MTTTPASTRSDPPGPLALALWFGLGTGFGVLAILGYSKLVKHRFLHGSLDSIWMAPLSPVVLFLILGLVLWLVRRGHGEWPSFRFSVSIYGALAALFILYMPVGFHRGAALALALGLGFQLGRMANTRADLVTRLYRWTIWPAGAMLVLLFSGTVTYRYLAEKRALGALPGGRHGPNVLLIVLDTVRASSLGLYGYHKPTSPELERFAAKGTRFDQAFSTAPWTLPSHASLMTGRWAYELSADWRRPLDGTFPTLAEAFRAKGYRTAGFVANTWYCSAESGLARGFIHYEDLPRSFWSVVRSTELGKQISNIPFLRALSGRYHKFGRKFGPEISHEALNWMGQSSEAPFFVFLNYFDAHGPYDPPAPFDSLFDARASRSNPDLRPTTSWDSIEVAREQRAYEASIAYLDHVLGELFGELDRRGLSENTVVVVTADHGEEFLEHGVMEHGNSVYRAGVHVPLLIRWPGQVPAGRVEETPVSLRDVPPTLLALAAGETGPFPGRSLQRFWGDDSLSARSADEPIVISVSAAPGLPEAYPVTGGPLHSIQHGGLRYIIDGHHREELYDVTRDSLELVNLIADSSYLAQADSLRVLIRPVLTGQVR